MVEVLVYGVTCGVLALAGAFNPIEKFWDAATGGVVEEFVESVIDKAFKGGAIFFNRHKKSCRTMVDKSVNLLKGLSKEEAESLQHFFKTHKAKLNKETEFGVDFEKLSSSDKKAAKEESKKLAKQLIALYKKEADTQKKTIHFVKAEQAIADVFGAKAGEYPQSLKELVQIVITHVYEILYVGLSSDDRDMAKVIQYMLQENNEELVRRLGEKGALEFKLDDSLKGIVEDLKDTVAMILQQHESAGIAKAKTDPFCFVKLVCPDCHASGEFIVRKNDRAHCKKCGMAYDIIKNDEEMKRIIDETKETLLQKMQLDGEETRGLLDGELTKIAEKIVTVEYFEQKFKEMEADSKRREREAKDEAQKSKDFANAVWKGISERIDLEGKKLETVFRSALGEVAEGVALSQALSLANAEKLDCVRSMLERTAVNLENAALTMQAQMLHLGKRSEDILNAVMSVNLKIEFLKKYLEENGHKVLALGEHLEDKLAILHSEVKALGEEIGEGKGESTKKMAALIQDFQATLEHIFTEKLKKSKNITRNCPCCGIFEATFEPNGERSYRCVHCGFDVAEGDIRLSESHEKIQAELEQFAISVELDLDKSELYWEFERKHKASKQKRVRIVLGDEECRALGRANVRVEQYSLKEPETLILVGKNSCCLTISMINKILSTEGFCEVRTLVFGDRIQVDARVESPNAIRGWKYDKEKKVLRRR